MKNVNMKRFIPAVVIFIIIIVVIVMCIKGHGKENSGDFNMNGVQESTDSKNVENGNNNSQNNTEVEENDPNAIKQDEVTTVSDYVDEAGNKLPDETVQQLKNSVIEAFKGVPANRTGLNVDINNARIIFNRGVTTIQGIRCLVFSVYTQESSELRNNGMYAMSMDTTTLYIFNSDSQSYKKI